MINLKQDGLHFISLAASMTKHSLEAEGNSSIKYNLLERGKRSLSPGQTSSTFQTQHATFVGHSVAHCCMFLGFWVVKCTKYFAAKLRPYHARSAETKELYCLHNICQCNIFYPDQTSFNKIRHVATSLYMYEQGGQTIITFHSTNVVCCTAKSRARLTGASETDTKIIKINKTLTKL